MATFDLDFEKFAASIGLEFEWEESEDASLGIELSEANGKLTISRVQLDSAAYKCGLNAGDEWLGLDGLRVRPEWKSKLGKMLKVNQHYNFLVARMGSICQVTVTPEKKEKTLKAINIKDKELAEKALLMN